MREVDHVCARTRSAPSHLARQHTLGGRQVGRLGRRGEDEQREQDGENAHHATVTQGRDRSSGAVDWSKMGNVVEMNAPTRRRRRSSRTALVLGGGGFTGGVYQIGALRALDLLSSNRSVNQFDIYVGTSAGSLIAALAANGVTPEEMMRTVNDQVPYSLPPLDREMLLRFNRSEFAWSALKLPLQLVSVARSVAASIGSLSAVDLVLALG